MSIDYETARIKMVDNQIRPTDVTSYPVIEAFLSVPREEFVPSRFKALAYIDSDIEIASADDGKPARYLSEPSPLAKLIQLAKITPDDLVLDIGCGTGYSSAVMSLIAGSVVALESDETLAEQATDTLNRLGFDNVAVVTGELEAGYAPEATYDVIFIGGAVETVPQALFDQLGDGGRLVTVEGRGNASRARVYFRDDDVVSGRSVFNTAIPSLPGFKKVEEFEF